MMETTLTFLDDLIHNIDDVIQQELSNRSKNPDYLRLGVWQQDEILKTMINDLKSQSEIVSHSCVKFALLITPTVDFTSNVITSILDELHQQCQMLINVFQ
jgi:hypothetical protein